MTNICALKFSRCRASEQTNTLNALFLAVY